MIWDGLDVLHMLHHDLVKMDGLTTQQLEDIDPIDDPNVVSPFSSRDNVVIDKGLNHLVGYAHRVVVDAPRRRVLYIKSVISDSTSSLLYSDGHFPFTYNVQPS